MRARLSLRYSAGAEGGASCKPRGGRTPHQADEATPAPAGPTKPRGEGKAIAPLQRGGGAGGRDEVLAKRATGSHKVGGAGPDRGTATGGASGSTGHSGASGTTGGAGGATCRSNDDCSESEYCVFPDGLCGSGERGACTSVAHLATDGMPACGCDGVFYQERSYAAINGVDTDVLGRCGDQSECGDKGMHWVRRPPVQLARRDVHLPHLPERVLRAVSD